MRLETIVDQPTLTPKQFEAEFLRNVREDDGTAADAMLAAGRPIHIRREDTPPGHVIRIYPDGREELIYVDLGPAKTRRRSN